jgi:SHS2 domain-containing protein
VASQGRPTARRRWGPFPTTADVGIWARASDPEGLFEALGLGLTALAVDLRTLRAHELQTLRVSSSDLPGLTVSFLSELIVRQQVDGFFARRIEVRFAPSPAWAIDARLYGERFDPDRHTLRIEVKAVTFHRLTIDLQRPRARVIVDI